VSSRIDYCNSLLYGLPDYKLKRLQRVQNIACRVVSRAPQAAHVTPLLDELHWLPVAQRIRFKVLLLTYRALHSLAPSYLCELVTPYTPGRSLRSADKLLLAVPQVRLKSYGERCFEAAAAKEWNDLTPELRKSCTFSIFKLDLKTFLFEEYFN